MRRVLAFTFLILSFPCIADNYIGIDYKHRWMRGRDKGSYAMSKVLGKNYNEYEVYLSHRFDNGVGLSIGWEQSKTENTTHTFVAGEKFLGPLQSAGDSTNIDTQIRAVNIGVHGYLNIFEELEAIGTLGIAVMQSRMSGTLTASGVTTNLDPARTVGLVPVIGMGFQYFFVKHLGIRVNGSWNGTNMFSQKFTDEDGVRRNVRPFRQSWTAAVGLVGKL